MTPEDRTARDGIPRAVGLDPADLSDGELVARSPIDGAVLGRLVPTSPQALDATLDRAVRTFTRWRSIPPLWSVP